MTTINDNISNITDTIARCCQKSGISSEEITLVAATKTVPADRICEAVSAGITTIGENRVQEAEQKFTDIPAGITRHMIGHLQKNKVRKAFSLFDVIQSVDSLDLAERINSIAGEFERNIPIFIEVNISREVSKYGFFPEELSSAVDYIKKLHHLKIHGLMTLGKYTSDRNEIRGLYREMKEVYNLVLEKNQDLPSFRQLSMGMSHDCDIAIEEGATMIRLGTAIFGKREYKNHRGH